MARYDFHMANLRARGDYQQACWVTATQRIVLRTARQKRMSPKPPALPALTGLRFVAALLVVLFHRGLPYLGSVPAVIAGNGYVGVDLFFVLSGFILTYTYGHEARSGLKLRPFLVARFARVYPVYLLGLVVSAPIFFYNLQRTHSSDGLSVGVEAVTLTQGWVPSAACRWNCPGWTLSAEAFFYLCFPLLLVVVRSWSRPRLLLGGVALYGLALLSTWALMVSRGEWSEFVRYEPLLHLPSFGIGVLAGCLFLGRRMARSSWAGVAAVACLGVLALPSVPYLLLHNGLLAPLFALLIYQLAVGQGAVAVALATPAVVALGEASYALYILHEPVGIWMHEAAERIGVNLASGWYFVAYLATTLALSLAVLRYIEEPARRWIRSKLSP
jgi:peptidoglycan/LPS O-acetylase OafA/YrhL